MKRAIVAVIILPPLFVLANLRAPYIVNRNGASNIKVDIPIVVESENLHFVFSKLYTGKDDKVLDKNYSARVSAVYNLSYHQDVKCMMSFFAPSNKSVLVKVNDAECSVTINDDKSENQSDQPKEDDRTDENADNASDAKSDKKKINTVYTISFEADLKAGKNTVSVEYTQPLGKHETDYGYLKKSKWATTAEYIFGPIASWKRADDFKALISVQIPYERGIAEIVFGPDYKISLLTGKIIGNKNEQLAGSPPVKSKIKGKTHLTQSFTITDDIPEMIFIHIREQ